MLVEAQTWLWCHVAAQDVKPWCTWFVEMRTQDEKHKPSFYRRSNFLRPFSGTLRIIPRELSGPEICAELSLDLRWRVVFFLAFSGNYTRGHFITGRVDITCFGAGEMFQIWSPHDLRVRRGRNIDKGWRRIGEDAGQSIEDGDDCGAEG